jgi:hypothetical protein
MSEEEMNFLSEATTIGILLTLVFGALFFYLYSRVNYAEKRMGLMENILLDLKMSLENSNSNEKEDDYVPEPVGLPAPLEKDEVDALVPDSEEEYYRNIMANVEDTESIKEEEVVPSAPFPSSSGETSPKKTQVTPNYESMLKSELQALCDQRNIKVGKRPGRSELVAALRKYDEGSSNKSSEPQGSTNTSELFPLAAQLNNEEGFPVDLGATEISE